MSSDKNNRIIENLKMDIALLKFIETNEKNINSLDYNRKRRSYFMKKRIIIVTCTWIFLISGIVFATNYNHIKDYFSGLDKGIQSATEHGYIENPEMDYIKSDAMINEETKKIINDIQSEIKIENFMMDDVNLNTEFDIKFDEKIKDYIDLNNLHNVQLSDLIVSDEENRIIFSTNDKEAFEKFCKEKNLKYIFGEHNEKYLNNGLMNFPSHHNKEANSVKLIYNMYGDKMPKSKKLYFLFTKIILTEENNDNDVILNGKWEFSIDVPENMYNRSHEYYRVVNCDNDAINIYSSSVSETGFEIGVIISDIERPEIPFTTQELRDGINLLNQESENGILSDESIEFKEKYNKYMFKDSPISITESDLTNKVSYVENSNGKKYECTMSPSRNRNTEWMDGNKYNFYETFGMTKYDSTEHIKVVLYYYGKPITINLEKIPN